MNTELIRTAVGGSPNVPNSWPVPTAKINVITTTRISEAMMRPKPARRSRSA